MAEQQPFGHQAHDELRQRIPAYVSDLVLHPGRLAAHALLSEHLHGCAACRDEVEELAQLLHEAASAQLPPATAYPALTLDFLRPAPAAPAGPWLVDTLGRLVLSFSEQLLDQIRPVAFASMARSRTARVQLYQYEQVKFETIESRQPHPVTVTVFGVGASPVSVELVVNVPRAGRRPSELAGSSVTLRAPHGEQQLLTDKHGDAVFRDLPSAVLPHIQLVISVQRDAA